MKFKTNKLCNKVKNKFIQNKLTASEEYPVNKWNKTKQIIGNTYKEHLETTYNKKDEMQLMNIRRSYKNKDPNKHGHIHRTIRGKIKKVKEKWLRETCKQIEELEMVADISELLLSMEIIYRVTLL